MWSIFSRDPIKDFAFEVGEKVPGLEDQSIWTLHHGKRKANGEPVSIFAFDGSDGNDAVKQVAAASVKRLKTLRHPNVLTFIDSLETPKCIYIVTEPVFPLSQHLKSMNESASRELAISWGLHQITKGLSFLVNTVNLVHNNICMSSIFVDQSGEWKLGGVDYMYPATGDGSNLPPFKTLPVLEKYDPPEKSAKSRNKRSSKWSCDMWGLGCLIWEVFNGPLPRTSSLKVIGKISKNLVPHYCELVGANPASRPSPDTFIENCKSERSFMHNHFIDTNLFLEEIQIKDQKEKNEFFTELPKHLDNFPTDYSRHKILPQLLNAFQFGNAGSAVLPPLFKLGSLLDPDEYQNRIVPCVVKLFSSTDRATRIHLLRQLPLFIEHLKPQVVNSQIFPNIVTGFMDTNPAIREQSIKAMLLLAPKLNDNNLNNELMKHFARLQSRDDQGPIRTNTTVCLGKIACHLSAATRQKVIASAFTRAMRDPFPAARVAGVLALAGNVQFFSTKDCAYKALPSLSALTVDPDKNVRDNTFKTLATFIERLQKASDDPEYAAKIDEEATAVPTGTAASVVAGVTGWTGWMSTGVTSLTSRLYKKGADPQEGGAPQPENQTPASENAQVQMDKKDEDAAAEDDDDVSDYGENQDSDGWKDDGDGWDDLEDFQSPITPMPKTNGSASTTDRKIVMVSKLKAIEESIWSELNIKTKIAENDEVVMDDDDAQDDGWDDNGWDADGFDDVAPSKPVSTSKSKSTVKSATSKTSAATASSGWDDWGDDDDDSGDGFGSRSSFGGSNKKGEQVQPASSYNWGAVKDVNPDSDDFFADIVSKPAPKPSKKLGQPAKRNPQATSVGNQKKVEKKESKPAVESSFDTGDDEWGWGNDWGNPNQGISKAEQMKMQREEKRRQRQEEMEKKRAARASGGGKLGARKTD